MYVQCMHMYCLISFICVCVQWFIFYAYSYIWYVSYIHIYIYICAHIHQCVCVCVYIAGCVRRTKQQALPSNQYLHRSPVIIVSLCWCQPLQTHTYTHICIYSHQRGGSDWWQSRGSTPPVYYDCRDVVGSHTCFLNSCTGQVTCAGRQLLLFLFLLLLLFVIILTCSAPYCLKHTIVYQNSFTICNNVFCMQYINC